jgi:RNA polymerase primary sigma factor
MVLSLNPIGPPVGDEGAGSLEDLLADLRPAAPAEGAAAEEVGMVLAHLGRLGPREASVLRMRFGLDGQEPRSLQAIGEHLGLTRERIRQIEREALRTLGRLMGVK